jgi:hypothetical protein
VFCSSEEEGDHGRATVEEYRVETWPADHPCSPTQTDGPSGLQQVVSPLYIWGDNTGFMIIRVWRSYCNMWLEFQLRTVTLIVIFTVRQTQFLKNQWQLRRSNSTSAVTLNLQRKPAWTPSGQRRSPLLGLLSYQCKSTSPKIGLWHWRYMLTRLIGMAPHYEWCLWPRKKSTGRSSPAGSSVSSIPVEVESTGIHSANLDTVSLHIHQVLGLVTFQHSQIGK